LAVARHDPDILSRLPMPLSTAGTTALGHSLLHIASLPLISEYIDKKNPYSVQSIHCARTPDSDGLLHAPNPLHLDPNRRPGHGLTSRFQVNMSSNNTAHLAGPRSLA